MTDINNMSANAISEEIAELNNLASRGQITPNQAMRLAQLKSARNRIDAATCGSGPTRRTVGSYWMADLQARGRRATGGGT